MLLCDSSALVLCSSTSTSPPLFECAPMLRELGASSWDEFSECDPPPTSLWNRAAVHAASALTGRLSAAFVYLVTLLSFF